MKIKTIKSFLQWEQLNWARAICFWFDKIKEWNNLDLAKARVLELGAGKHGELTLIFSYVGVKKIVCSDLTPRSLEKARKLHVTYKSILKTTPEYLPLNAVNINLKEKFDIVTFKSVLGGVSANQRNELKYKMIEEIYKILSPNGYLLFVENLNASSLHMFLRKYFVK